MLLGLIASALTETDFLRLTEAAGFAESLRLGIEAGSFDQKRLSQHVRYPMTIPRRSPQWFAGYDKQCAWLKYGADPDWILSLVRCWDTLVSNSPSEFQMPRHESGHSRICPVLH